MDIFTAFGLSVSAGLNAYIPLLIVSLVAKFTDIISLNSPWDALTSWWVIGLLVLLSLVEFFADKIPAVNHINDAIQTFVRPVAGAVVRTADRFALGVSRVAYTGEAFTMMLAGSDAKALVKMAKTGKWDESAREVTVEVVDAGAQVTFRFSTGEAMTVRGLDVQFPKWRHLLPSDTSRMGGIVGMGYTGVYL